MKNQKITQKIKGKKRNKTISSRNRKFKKKYYQLSEMNKKKKKWSLEQEIEYRKKD